MSVLGFKIPSFIGGSTSEPLPEPLDTALEIFRDPETKYASGTWTGLNATTLYQSTGSAQPTLVDGTNRLSFDGGDRLLNAAGDPFLALLADKNDLTFAIIFTVANQDASQGLFETYRSAGDPTLEYVFLRAIDAGLDGYLTAFEKRTAQIFARYDSGTASDTLYLAVVRCKRAGKLTLNRNSTAEVESSGTNADVAHGTFSNFRLGYAGDGQGTGTYLIGEISAFMAWDVELTDTQVSLLRSAVSDDVLYGSAGVTF